MIRTTFGIRNKEGKIYPDIVVAFLQDVWITDSILRTKRIEVNSTLYRVHMDSKLKRKIAEVGTPYEAIGSFQIRTNGNFAMLRMIEESRKGKKWPA